jgi:hypothetical protein
MNFNNNNKINNSISSHIISNISTQYQNILTSSTISVIENTTSTSFITTKKKSTGLVDDLCVKVIGDCEKYMECKKFTNLALNISSCQCIHGYVKDETNRLCSMILIFFKL